MAQVADSIVNPRSMEKALADLRATYALRPTQNIKSMIAHLEAEIAARQRSVTNSREAFTPRLAAQPQ
jgi:uncharacterized UPF0146 family protein